MTAIPNPASGPMGAWAREIPWMAKGVQDWASELLESSHSEALFAFGELVVLTMMWKPTDFARGLVGKCLVCQVDSEVSEAFAQPEEKKCLGCYGTTFAGGIRAQVVRPAIFSDRNQDTVDAQQGELVIETLMVETTGDVSFRRGDYIFRTDNLRYQGDEVSNAVLRTGFSLPNPKDSFRGTIPQAHLEDETSVAHLIPPRPEALALLQTTLLDDGSGVPLDLTEVDYVAENGYV